MNPPPRAPTVIELRQYTLYPGKRDILIELFERQFVETREAEGLQVPGLVRDAGRADRFAWMRGFTDLAARGHGLAAFYGGPARQAHGAAANATMIDSNDVPMLRTLVPWVQPAPSAAGVWQIVVWRRAARLDSAALRDGTAIWLETETAPNDFPRLPARENEDVLVAVMPGAVRLPDALHQRLGEPRQVLNLHPTTRSPLR